jgi:hypothetical protein
MAVSGARHASWQGRPRAHGDHSRLMAAGGGWRQPADSQDVPLRCPLGHRLISRGLHARQISPDGAGRERRLRKAPAGQPRGAGADTASNMSWQAVVLSDGKRRAEMLLVGAGATGGAVHAGRQAEQESGAAGSRQQPPPSCDGGGGSLQAGVLVPLHIHHSPAPQHCLDAAWVLSLHCRGAGRGPVDE